MPPNPHIWAAVGRVWDRLPLPVEHVAGIGAGLGLQRFRPARSPRWLSPVGGLLAVTGAVLSGWAVRERGEGDIDHPARLTTSGLHGVTRNPMYVSWSLIHLGVGLALRNPWVLATWSPSLAFLHRVVLREEAELAARFGDEYEAYRAQVPRYLHLPSWSSWRMRPEAPMGEDHG